MHSPADVDELIETEVCNRLIRLSCAKMVNSKNERGGAKLHRSLLILHLLRRARSEQNRCGFVHFWFFSCSHLCLFVTGLALFLV